MPLIKNENNAAQKILNAMIAFALVGLLIGSFFDLQINKLLFANGTIFPTAFKIAGEMPMSILIIAVSFALIQLRLKNKEKLPGYVLPTLIIIGFFFFFSRTIPGYFGISNQFISLSITLFYLLTGYLISQLAKDLDEKKLKHFAYFVISTILLTLAIMSLMKSIWGRERFISMHQAGNFDNFTFWLFPQGFSEGDFYRSFPSGHTSSAATMLTLLFVPELFKKFEGRKSIYIFAVAWPILVFFSRIFDGAHFLTDVSTGLLLVSAITKLTSKLILKED